MIRVIGYSILALLFSGLGFLYTYFLPQVEAFALERLNKLGTRHSPFVVQAEKLSLKPYLISAEIHNLELTPKDQLKETLSKISARNISGRLSLFGLLRGQIRIASVKIDHITTQVFINTDSKTDSEISIPLKQIFALPVDSVEVTNGTLLGKINPQNTVFKLENIELIVENRFRSVWLDLNAPIISLKPSGPSSAVEFQAEARGLVESHQIRLTALKVKRDESYLVSSGFFSGDIEKGKILSTEVASKLRLDVSSLKDWFAAFLPSMKLPKLDGTVDVTASSGIKSNEPYTSFKIETLGLIFDRYQIGNAKLDGSYSQAKIKELSGTIENRSGRFTLNKFNMDTKEPYSLEVDAASNIELGAFLDSIGIGKVPLHLRISGKARCHGALKPSLTINCDQAEADVNNLHVYSDEDKEIKTIVKVKEGRIKGSAEISETEVKFAADAQIGSQSKGSGKGSIDYQNGFVIFFKGDHVDFNDVENLADIKLEGNGALEGETRGNSHTANFVLNAKMKDVAVDDFKLGQVASQVRYDKGYLHFKDTSGLFETTRYSGHMSLNLPESQIYLYVKSPYLELPDLKTMIEKRLFLPIALAGTGDAEFKASGPIDITKMNYEIKASVFRGNIAGESFDSIHAQLRATEGVLATERVRLSKGPGEVVLEGILAPEWSVDLTVTGHKLRLEQSEYISGIGLDVQGQYSFVSKVKGEIESPQIEINLNTKNMIVGSVQVDDSQIRLNIDENQIKGFGELLGKQLVADFVYPFSENGPFSLNARAEKLNVANVFEAVSQARQSYDFQTTVSMSAQLSSPRGGFFKSSGSISIDQFEIRKGGQSLNSEEGMKLLFDQGTVHSENFGMVGDGNYIRLNLRPSHKDRIDGHLNGKLDLNLFSPFVTFAGEMRGLLSINTSFKGDLSDINMSGSAYLDSGYLKANDFPHPFSNVRADMLFNQKTLFFNSVQGDVADGKLSADGRILFENTRSTPMNINGQIREASFNFPEGFKTRGSAHFSLEGQSPPYRFKMAYEVQQTDIVSEFGGGEKASGVRKSPYLPPSIAKTSEDPFYLDLDLKFLNPISISNSMIKSSIRGDLKVKGTASQLLMSGTLTPQPGGKVFFRDVPFEILNGFVEFDSSPPDNPKLYLAAMARVTETGFDEDRRQMQRQFDVNMLIQGRAQSPQVTLTSQPPLPQKDIVSLLALGLTPEALDESRATGNQMTSTSTTAIGAALLQKPVGKRLKDQFGVDMKVSSSQNNADVGSSARVTLSKQWTPKLSVAASGTLEANPRSSVRLEYQFNRSLSVIGSWEGREQGSIQENQRKDVSNSILGLDLEYRVQFK